MFRKCCIAEWGVSFKWIIGWKSNLIHSQFGWEVIFSCYRPRRPEWAFHPRTGEPLVAASISQATNYVNRQLVTGGAGTEVLPCLQPTYLQRFQIEFNLKFIRPKTWQSRNGFPNKTVLSLHFSAFSLIQLFCNTRSPR